MAVPALSWSGCESGGVIAGGRFVAPSISGSTWTPSRDDGGNIVAGNWIGLPINTTLYVGSQTLNDVVEMPHYIKYGGGDSANGIISAWAGMAFDYVNQAGYICNGGHYDSSACETGIYKADFNKLTFSRIKNRNPMGDVQAWNESTSTIDSAENFSGSGYGGVPLANGGFPGASHTYNGIVWVPPSLLGNTSGGIFFATLAKTIYDIDAGTWKTTNFFKPSTRFFDYSNSAAFLDGSKFYGPYSQNYHWVFDTTQTDPTDYSATSYGKFTTGGITNGKTFYSGDNSIWGVLRERREEFSIAYGASVRIRYGQAIDASATNWASYADDITLTSSDGSHLDFSSAALNNSTFTQCGKAYDHATGTLYLVPNVAGAAIYKITGLSGNTWTIEKIAGTSTLAASVNHVYGRCVLIAAQGRKFLVQITSKDVPMQITRVV